MSKVDAEKAKTRQLWRSVDGVLGRGRVPPCDNIEAEQFHRCFDDKIAAVRSSTSDAPPPSFSPTSADFSQFQSVNVDDVVAAIRTLPDKSCVLDPFLTSLLKTIVHIIAPFLTELFNRSLSNGVVPEVFKVAHITTLLKKSDMDPMDPRSYRPISNLSVVSKLMARFVARQLLSHLQASGMVPRLQSVYRENHFTEIAVFEGFVRHPARHRLRRPIRSNAAGLVGSLRHGRPPYSTQKTRNFVRTQGKGVAVAPDVLGRSTSTRASGVINIVSSTHLLRCTTGARYYFYCTCTPPTCLQ